MSILRQTIGVDISKDDFVAYAERIDEQFACKRLGQRKFTNNQKGIKEFISWFTSKTDEAGFVQVVMEATGRYHEPLAYHLHELRHRISIVLPNRIKNFARSLNQHSKTDPIDAKVIARYGGLCGPDAWRPANQSMRNLREYTRERQDIIKMRTQASNRISAQRAGRHPSLKTIERLEEQIEVFDQQLEQILADIETLRSQDEQFDQSITLLTSIPHIGLITAYVILSETNGFTLFDNRNQLIKFAGLDVTELQSGSSIKGQGRISKRGNANLRSAPYMAAVGVNRKDSVFQETYQRHLLKHGVKKKAIIAVVRQLLKVAFGVHQSGQPYNENIHRLRVQKKIDEHNGSPMVANLAD